MAEEDPFDAYDNLPSLNVCTHYISHFLLESYKTLPHSKDCIHFCHFYEGISISGPQMEKILSETGKWINSLYSGSNLGISEFENFEFEKIHWGRSAVKKD